MGITVALTGCVTEPPKPQPPVPPQPPSTPASPETPVAASEAAKTAQNNSSDAAEASETRAESGKMSTQSSVAGVDSGSEQTDPKTGNARPASSAAPGTSSSQTWGDLPAVKTDEEERAELNKKFDASLAAFDGKLQREQKVLAESEAEGRASGPARGGAVGSSTGGALEEEEPLSARAPSQSSGGGSVPDREPDREANASRDRGQVSSGAIPPDIPDGHDDDIVARQIREAAENETDPELREKLWEEYRRYKRS